MLIVILSLGEEDVDVGGLVPDGVTSPQSDPLRDGSVLLLGFRQLLLRPEGLVALWEQHISIWR